jgi:hypothetical protein
MAPRPTTFLEFCFLRSFHLEDLRSLSSGFLGEDYLIDFYVGESLLRIVVLGFGMYY